MQRKEKIRNLIIANLFSKDDLSDIRRRRFMESIYDRESYANSMNIDKFIQEYYEILTEEEKRYVDEAIEEYDNCQLSKEEKLLQGVCKKRFIRIYSDEFPNFIKAINQKNSYVTYINDLAKDGYYPKYLSILLKEVRSRYLAYNEVICSRLANALDIPVTYYDIVLSKFQYEREDYMKDNNTPCENDRFEYLVAVDFISKDENFSSLAEFAVNSEPYDLPINLFFKTLYDSCRAEYPNATDEDLRQVLEDFVIMYLFKRFVVRDEDFFFKNLGVLYNEKMNRLRLAPLFDMELTFPTSYMSRSDYDEIKFDMEFLRSYFPKTLNKFMKKLNKFIESKNIKGFVNKYIEDKVHANSVIQCLNNNINAMLEIYQTSIMSQKEN